MLTTKKGVNDKKKNTPWALRCAPGALCVDITYCWNTRLEILLLFDVSDINEFEGAIENLPVNTWQEWRPHLVTVRHDGGFYKSAPGVGTKMNFVDFNVILEGHSTVEFRNIVIANVGE